MILGAELAGLLRRGEVEKLILAARKPAENRGGQRSRRDAVADPVKVHLDRLDRFFFFLFLLFVFLVVLLFLVAGFLVFFLIVLLVRFVFLFFVGRFFFVALRLEGRFLIGF